MQNNHFSFMPFFQFILALLVEKQAVQFLYFVGLCLLIITACSSPQSEITEKSKDFSVNLASFNETNNQEEFALVELFTSEGCSSCPPADELASKTAKQADKENENIYVLAYHVDYWNRLGWKDRFSSPKFTKRQEWYANTWKSSSLYTPQMVINGEVEFVGSNETLAQKNIKAALAKTSKNEVKITLTQSKKIEYGLEKQPQNSILNIAWIQKELTSQITAGENRGRRLHHYSVVKDLEVIEKPSSKGEIVIPEFTKEGDFEVVLFLQNLDNGKIFAAKKLKITQKQDNE